MAVNAKRASIHIAYSSVASISHYLVKWNKCTSKVQGISSYQLRADNRVLAGEKTLGQPVINLNTK